MLRMPMRAAGFGLDDSRAAAASRVSDWMMLIRGGSSVAVEAAVAVAVVVSVGGDDWEGAGFLSGV